LQPGLPAAVFRGLVRQGLVSARGLRLRARGSDLGGSLPTRSRQEVGPWYSFLSHHRQRLGSAFARESNTRAVHPRTFTLVADERCGDVFVCTRATAVRLSRSSRGIVA